MNTTINPHGLSVPQPSTSGGKPVAAGDADGSSSAPAVAAGTPGSDSVQLTESARAIEAATRATDAPPVDAQHVEHLRQSIADGSYKVDAQRVADRLINLEKQIG